MGRRLYDFDVLENLFDDFAREVEWGNKDYDPNPFIEEDGEYAPTNE
jgi:hypothetical protein